MHKFNRFNSKEDPHQHLWSFKHGCYLIAHDDALLLRTFPMSLTGPALDWYSGLPRHSIFSFNHVAQAFLDHFSINIVKKVTMTDLYSMHQYEDESIADFVAH